jgi:hypothetical protein
MVDERNRMIVDVTREVQMAIKLRAIKLGITTGAVVAQAIEIAFPDDLKEARHEKATKEK